MAHSQDVLDNVMGLWREGYSYGQIAREIPGVTRSSAAGIVSRMRDDRDEENRPRRGPAVRLSSRPNKVVPVKKPPSFPKAPENEPVPALGPDGKPYTLRTAPTGACRWINDWEPTGESAVCGHPVASLGSSWCAFHHYAPAGAFVRGSGRQD